MSGTLLKIFMLSGFLFSNPVFAADNSAFVVAAATKSAQLAAALHLAKASKDGEPTAQLFNSFGDGGEAIESWLVTQKVKDAEAPLGRKLVHMMVYVDVQLMDKEGKELEKPNLKIRAMRVANVVIADY